LPTRKEPDATKLALYEAAKAELEELQKVIRQRQQRRLPTGPEILKEQSARAKVFLARVRLSGRPPDGT
jgi:hypothetical protein